MLILEGYEIGTAHTELPGYFFLARAGKRVEMRHDFSAPETGFGQGREIACRLQSTRNSANPEFDIVERRRRQFGVDHDIGELHPPATAQNSMQFGKHLRFFGTKVDDAI